MSKMRKGRVLVALGNACSATSVFADGHLLAVGGMLRASNLPVYRKFVDLAGGAGAANIVIVPTASGSLGSSKRFQTELVALGVPASHVTIASIDNKTVMDASHATRQFGVYGTELHNVQLAMLGNGDRYNLATNAVSPAEGKEVIKPGDEYLVGNQLITDLSAVAAMRRAVLYGLADNTATRQSGLMTRYNPFNGYHYGYRFDFAKTPGFIAHSRTYDSLTSYTAQGVRLDVTPVDAWLRPAQKTVPTDIPSSQAPNAVRAVVFRGLMTCNEVNAFEPARAMTRGELANTLQMTLAGELKIDKRVIFTDLSADSPLFEQAEIVVSNGWMKTGPAFEPNKPVTRDEWAEAVNAMVAQGLVKAVPADTRTGDATVRRDEVAEFIARAYELADNS